MNSHLFFLILIGILLAGSCAMITKASGAASGAMVGAAVGGPPGAAVGAAAGYIGAEVTTTDEAPGPFGEAAPPEDVWSLLGYLVDKAYWLLILAGAGYIVALMLPPPGKWSIWRKIKNGWKARP